MIKLAALLLFMSIVVTAAAGADYYLSPTGSDGGNGSKAHPWATLNRAAKVVRPGATVHVAPGTYTGNIVTDVAGNSGARITYVSDQKWGAKLVGAGGGAVWCNNGSYVTIEGFEVTGPNQEGIEANCSRSNVGFVEIRNNYVHDIPGDNCKTSGGGAGIGVDLGYYTSHDITVDGNVVKNIGPGQPPGSEFCASVHGIYVTTHESIITNNVVSNVSGWGICMWHHATGARVINNTVTGGQDGGILVGSAAEPVDNTVIANNILFKNRVGLANQKNRAGSFGSRNTYSHNLFFANWRRDASMEEGQKNMNAVNKDPQFVDADRGDYRLRPGSPATGAGDSDHAPQHDIERSQRPRSKGVDLGAYQRDNAVPPVSNSSALKRHRITNICRSRTHRHLFSF